MLRDQNKNRMSKTSKNFIDLCHRGEDKAHSESLVSLDSSSL